MVQRTGQRGSAGRIRRMGVMGGTFNPVHFGHLVAAEEAHAQFDLDLVLFMPTGKYEHKDSPENISAEDRYLMAVIATAANPAFEVSRLEVDRKVASYTIDTVKALRHEYGDETDIYFITGADVVLKIAEWKKHEDLADYCRFIAVTRPGYDLARLKDLAAGSRRIPRISVIEVPALSISSTDLRRRVREGRSIRYLLPGAVANYIHKEGLYL